MRGWKASRGRERRGTAGIQVPGSCEWSRSKETATETVSLIERLRMRYNKTTPMGIGHHTCHHFYPLILPPEYRFGATRRRLTATAKLAVPAALWPEVAARVASGESLRAVAADYGVSHECVRRIAGAAKRNASAPSKWRTDTFQFSANSPV